MTVELKPVACSVEVKALEWSKSHYPYTAETPFGRYSIWAGKDVWLGDREVTKLADRPKTVEHAKAAAQSDYEQRIRSALAAPRSPVSPEVDGLVERLKKRAGGEEDNYFEGEGTNTLYPLLREAASELSRLAGERDRLSFVVDQLHGPLSVAALEARAESAEARALAAESTISSLSGEVERLTGIICDLFVPDQHFDGCLFKENRRFPCQCGHIDRLAAYHAAVDAAKQIRADFDALSTQKGDHPE